MSFEAVASRYAQAVFDIGVEGGNLPRLAEEMKSFSDTYSASPDLRAILENPLVPEDGRRAVLDEIARRLGLGDIVKNTLRLLVQRNRLIIVPALARTLLEMSDEKEGIVRAVVTSAQPLNESYSKRLQSELEKMTGKKVIITRETDPALIAGLVTRVGDRILDGSVRSRLEDMRSRLLSM